MPIVFNCPTCQAQLTLSDAAAGRQGKCPHCKGEIVVPSSNGEVPAGAPAVPSSASTPALHSPAAAITATPAPPPRPEPVPLAVEVPFDPGILQPHRGPLVLTLGVVSITL